MLLTGYAARIQAVIQALRQALQKCGVAGAFVVLAVAGMLASMAAQARTPELPSTLPIIALASLPVEAQATEKLIRTGGPFASGKDGSVFGNREQSLPRRPRGHYREYTVRTPGAKNRGARRIVCGGTPPTAPEVCFYTDDHYASFRRIAQ